MHSLEVPQELAGVGVDGEQRVGVEVVADAVAAVEVHHSGARGRVDDAALLVERHAGPVIGGAGGLPRIGGQVL